MTTKKRFIPMLLTAALFGALALFTPQGAAAQLGECFECVYSSETHCMMCRHFTEAGDADCTTPECAQCGLALPCNPTLAAAAEDAASEAIDVVRTRLATRLVAAEAPASDVAFATTIAPMGEPAGTIASIRKELSENSLYLSADGIVRTCEGTVVGQITLPGPEGADGGVIAEIARGVVTVAGRQPDAPAVSSVARQ